MTKPIFPILRFKDFDDELKNFKIGEISDSYSGGTPSASNKNFYTGTIPFIRSAEINKEETELFINEAALNQSSAKMVVKGDILYALYGATSGEVGISRINGAINQAILAIKPYKGYSSKFIMQWLRREKNSIIDKYLQGGQGNLSGTIVKNLDVQFPTYPEQSSIGSLFQTLDELLSAYKDNLVNYQVFKASMLSKMFPKAGQTTPEIRLEGFVGEWELEGLGKVVKRIKSYSLSRDVETLEQTGLKYIHYGDIHTGKAGFIKEDNELPYIIPDEKYTSLLEKGDLVFADASEDYKGIATVAVINDETKDNIIAGLHTIAIRPNEQLDSIFLYYQFKTQVFRKHGYKVGTGMKVFGISPDNLFKFQLAFPDKSEQRAIGAFFSNLDDLISNYQDKITQLEILKKKLLQEMFV